MAATYVIPIETAKDRVRLMIADRAAPFRFQDEEIAYELTKDGFDGDPLATTDPQEQVELIAAISLLESEPETTSGNASTTVKQGSVVRINQAGTGGRSGILSNLRTRLKGMLGDGGPVVVDGFADDRRFQNRPFI